MPEDITKMSTDKLQKHWDSHKDEQRPSPVFASHLKRVASELAKRKKAMKEEFMSEQKPPFDGPYTKTKGTVTDKSGAKHSPMSRARDLARDAMKKNMSAPKKKSVSESRQASIVREAAKDAKEKAKTKDEKKTGTKDKFEAEPELTSQIVTTNNQ
jgi:hypothetical protein